MASDRGKYALECYGIRRVLGGIFSLFWVMGGTAAKDILKQN